MYGKVVAAALVVVIPAFVAVTPAVAACVHGQQARLTELQRLAIHRAFFAAVPDLGIPEIHAYRGGSYRAEARKGDIVAEVTRDEQGRVNAAYTVTRGQHAARGTARADAKGNSETWPIFGSPEDKRDAMYAAERLARTLAGRCGRERMVAT
jgi:hypothetical protein